MIIHMAIVVFFVIIFAFVPESFNPDHLAYAEIYSRKGFNFFGLTDGIVFGLLNYTFNSVGVSYEVFGLTVQAFVLSCLVFTCDHPTCNLRKLSRYIKDHRDLSPIAKYICFGIYLMALFCVISLFYLFSTVTLRQGVAISLLMLAQYYLYRQVMYGLPKILICLALATAAFLTHSSVAFPIAMVALAYGKNLNLYGFRLVVIFSVLLGVTLVTSNVIFRPEMQSSLNIVRCILGLLSCLGVFGLLFCNGISLHRCEVPEDSYELCVRLTKPKSNELIDQIGINFSVVVLAFTSSLIGTQLLANSFALFRIFQAGEVVGRIVPGICLLLVPHISSKKRGLSLGSSVLIIFAGIFIINDLCLKPFIGLHAPQALGVL